MFGSTLIRSLKIMKKKVTVIIPVYNTKAYLTQCVSSVMEQTYPDLEILLIDDGSTDGSGPLCDSLAKQDERVRVIHKQNGGLASARNCGLAECSGDYIMFLDSDDWLDSSAIGELVHHAECHDADVVRFNYVREFAGKQIPKRNTFLEERVYRGEECTMLRRQILGLTGTELRHPESTRFLASCWLNVYRRDLLKENEIKFHSLGEIGAFEDGLFNFSVFFYVKKFVFLDRPYYHYRKTNAGSLTANYKYNYMDRQLRLFEILRSTIENEGSWSFYREAFHSHILYSTMEISLNAMRNNASLAARYHEIKKVLKHPVFMEAYRDFCLNNMPLKWKVYYFCIKHSMVLPTYLITTIIMKLKSKGTS